MAVLFLQRAYDRHISNGHQLCRLVIDTLSTDARLVDDSLAERHGLCAMVEIVRQHGIFVVTEGSQIVLLSFARRGSVAIIAYPLMAMQHTCNTHATCVHHTCTIHAPYINTGMSMVTDNSVASGYIVMAYIVMDNSVASGVRWKDEAATV